MMYDTVASVLPHIKAGKLRPLAVATAKRRSRCPMSPDRRGCAPGFRGDNVVGALVPAKTPKKEIVTGGARSTRESAEILNSGRETNG